jgi:hypothetical protein
MEAFFRSLSSPALCSQQLLPASCFFRFAGTRKRRSLPTAYCPKKPAHPAIRKNPR